MYPYPTEISQEIGVLVSALAEPSTLIDATHRQAGWVVLGFGLKLLGGAAPVLPPFFAASGTEQHDEDTEERLLTLLAPHAEATGPEATGPEGTIPWGIVVPLLFNLLHKWLVG